MRNRAITKEARVVQLARGAAVNEVDGSVRMAIKNLQAQLQALHAKVNEMASGAAGAYDETGAVDAAGTASRTVARMINNSGQDVDMGDVVIIDVAQERSFTVVAGAESRVVAGVVASDSADGAAPAIADGEEGLICVGGVAYVNVDADAASISVGDPLETGAVEKTAVKALPYSPGIFAVALEAKASGTGIIRATIRVEAQAHAEAINNLQQFDYSLCERSGYFVAGYDADGAVTGFSGIIVSAAVWVDSSMSQFIGHWTYGYNSSGMLISAVHSAFNSDGTLQCVVSRALEYQSERIDRIISEIS